MKKCVKETLQEIAKSIERENVSYGEILFLQNHQKKIKEIGDVKLAEWAGISEEEWNDKTKSASRI